MRRAKITGVGHAVPERVITNRDLEKMMDTSNEWIVSRTGIEERHWVTEGEGTSDLAIRASRNALHQAEIDPREIDLVVVGSLTSDYFFPGVGNQLQDKLGLDTVPSFDIKAACSAFIYALSIGDQFIKTGQANTVLVVGAEVQSTALDISTEGRDMSVLFGDGAGAVILQPSNDDTGILSTHLHSEGKYLKELWCEAPASRFNPRLSPEMLAEGRQYPKMNGREVFRNAVTRFPEVIQEALEANHLTLDDISLIIPHQANLRISQMIAKKLGLSMDRLFSNIHKYGNTTGASIPIALSEALTEDRIHSGDNIILAAFGSGFTWASAAIRW
ncbi:MAG: ketoacyl-ACP synthase III [FCB group bacterium]|nr:ketoacyl-ACP synthase III [FCB group bacterium]